MYFLGYDLGASSYRAVLAEIDEKDRKIRVIETLRWPNQIIRVRDRLYWDLLEIWSNIKYGIKYFSGVVRERNSHITSIGVDSWGVDFVLIDRLGEPVGLPVSYRDPRTINVMEEVFKKISKEKIYEMTGIQFMRINTLYQLYSMILRKDPKISIAYKFLMIPDLFHYWLTNKIYVEYTNASTTQLLDPWRRRWHEELIKILGMPIDIFPDIIEPGTVIDEIDHKILDEIGLREKIVVTAPATHDTASAVAAAPMVREDTIYISSGTWSLIGVELRNPLINRKAFEYNFTNEGGVFGTIRFLKNVQGMWIIEEVRRVIKEREGIEFSYDEINRIVMEKPLIRKFIDPDHESFISPQDMIQAINNYLEKTGQEKPSDYGELFKIIYQSLAFKYRVVIKYIEDLIGKKIREINIVGGGSRNNLLNKMIADVSGRKVYAGPEEATSIGNILMQAKGLGIIRSLEELREYVKNSFQIKIFEPEKTDEYEEYYDLFLKKIMI
jgi:rhamnulokinase